MLYILICICIGYLFGCFSTGYMLGKLNHMDIRNHGSGNVGTTNALRTMGAKGGAITLIGDVLKAIIPIVILPLLIGDRSGFSSQLLALYIGLGVVLGHNFPFWLHFKGGKGIAATGGVVLAFDLRIAGILFLIFLVTILITKYVSLGSILIAIAFPLCMLLFYPGEIHIILLSLVFSALALIRHKENMVRLFKGTENKLGQKAKMESEE